MPLFVDDSAFELVLSTSILAELDEVLRRDSFRRRVTLTEAQVQTALRGVRSIAEFVPGNYINIDTVKTNHG